MVLPFLALILHAATSQGAALAPREIAPAPAPRLRVLIRIDPRGASKGFRIPEVVDQIREIWRPYIDIDFADAGTGNGLTARSESPAARDAGHGLPGYDDELTLLIIDRLQAQTSSGSSSEAPLGWTRFVAGRPENTVTVSLAAATSLMSSGRWLGRRIDELPPPLQRQFVTHALSRSAAHEIGHYLLRSSAHAPDGLMRQRMTVPEIMEEGLIFLRLRPSEVSVLESRVPHALAATVMTAEDGTEPPA
jgi:hypothetical protein